MPIIHPSWAAIRREYAHYTPPLGRLEGGIYPIIHPSREARRKDIPRYTPL